MSDSEEKNVENSQTPLKEALNIRELMKDGATFEVNFENEQEPDQLAYKPEDVYLYGNRECLDITDEDTYRDGQPFESLASLMTAITPNGEIKKRIIREGYGDTMPDNATVTVDYNAYLEYNDEPFDSTYIRKRPLKFCLGAGETIVGLDLAVQTMKISEKAQFLVEPKYAYGSLGCLERVPPNSTCLFEVEVKNMIDSGAAVTYEELSDVKQQDFDAIFKYANALSLKAKDLCMQGAWKPAVREYNTAVAKLENCRLRNIDDQEKQQQLLLKLYTNLAVVHTKLQDARRGCTSCNKAFNMCKGTSLRPSAKLYYNNARCLVLLGDYDRAEVQLKKAQRLEPNNVQISTILRELEEKINKSYKNEVNMAKAYFKSAGGESKVTQEFKDNFKACCMELLKDKTVKEYSLPMDFSDAELKFATAEVQKYGLCFEQKKNKASTEYCIVKVYKESLPSKMNNLNLK